MAMQGAVRRLLQPVEVRVARLLVLLLLLGVECPPVGAGRVVGGCRGPVAVGDGGWSVLVCWVATAVTRLVLQYIGNIPSSLHIMLSPSPSPCEVRMFCHRHTRRTGLRSLTRGHRSLTQGHRSCHMAGSSKQERLY